MSAPLAINLFSILLALGVLGTVQWRKRASALTSGGILLLAAFVLFAPINNPQSIAGTAIKIGGEWALLGRRLVLDEANRGVVGFIYLMGALLVGGGWMANPGRYFNSFAVLGLTIVASSLMIRPFLFAALLLEMAAMVAAIMLASAGSGENRGALRLLILYTLATMVILYAGWMIEFQGVTSGTPLLVRRASLLLGFGFAILLGVPPFHLWMPTAGEESNPYTLTFVAVLLQSGALFFGLQFINNFEWLRLGSPLLAGIRNLGIVMTVAGGIWALAQRSLGKLMAYALIGDFGVALIALGHGTAEGVRLALAISAARVIGLALWALGLLAVRGSYSAVTVDDIAGIGRERPFATAAITVGILSIGGFPLMAGFPPRWALLTSLGESGLPAAAAIVFLSFALTGAAIRWLRVSFGEQRIAPAGKLGSIERLFLSGGILFSVVFGLFPQIIFPWILQVTSGLSNLIP